MQTWLLANGPSNCLGNQRMELDLVTLEGQLQERVPWLREVLRSKYPLV